MNDGYRIEKDSLGEVRIPIHALWGAQTQRALLNFPISSQRFPREFIGALAQVKMACAMANIEMGRLNPKWGAFVIQACEEVQRGEWDDQYPLDVFQTGSGTSTNMNANEVIANRANVLAGGGLGSRDPVHPNDHVNMSQSSNDVIPTTIHVAATWHIRKNLLPNLRTLLNHLERKAKEFDEIIKIGRTHLQDATPIRLGQEFQGYATQVSKGIERAGRAIELLREIALGGTAVGSGMNRLPFFPERAILHLNAITSEDFTEAKDHFEANASRDACVEVSGVIRTIAVSLIKIADDIRWLGSGPRNGLSEIQIPSVQPGSSIMPGKVNPVIAESLVMAATQVISNDIAILQGGLTSRFELNTALPLIAYNILNSLQLLASSAKNFAEKCVMGIEADVSRCYEMAERSLAAATALTPFLGYDRASQISKIAYQSGKTIREVCLEMAIMPKEQIDVILNLRSMTEPGLSGGDSG